MPFLPNYNKALRSDVAHAVRFLAAAQVAVANGSRSWPGYPEPLMAFRLTDTDFQRCRDQLGLTDSPSCLAPLGQALARLLLSAADKAVIVRMVDLLTSYSLHSSPTSLRKSRSHPPFVEFGEHLLQRGYASELEMHMLELAELGYKRYLLHNTLCRNRASSA